MMPLYLQKRDFFLTIDPQVDNAKALKVADEEAMHHEAMKVGRVGDRPLLGC